MLKKEINVIFKDFEVELEHFPDMCSTILRLTEYVVDKEKTTQECDIYKVNNKIEVYPDYEQIKEMIKALQQILPEEE